MRATREKAKSNSAAAAELAVLRERHQEAYMRWWIAKSLNRPDAGRFYETEMLCRAQVMKAEQRLKEMEGGK